MQYTEKQDAMHQVWAHMHKGSVCNAEMSATRADCKLHWPKACVSAHSSRACYFPSTTGCV
jgi:hypothetical protein